MQGRFKRDGSASAEPEPHGGTDRGSSPQHAQSPGPTPSGDGGERSGRAGISATAGASGPVSPPSATSAAKGVPGPGSRMALRNWRISTRLVSLLALPVVAATSLGALRIGDSMNDIQQLDNMQLLTEMTTQATELAAALQDERDQSAGPLSHGLTANNYSIKGLRQKTDRAKDNFQSAAEGIDAASKDGNLQGVRDTLVGLVGQLDNLQRIRHDAYSSPQNSTQTVEAYHRLITQLIGLSQDMAEASSNPEMIQRTRALSAFSTAKEYASVQRAVIAAALPANNTTTGKLSENDRLYGQSAYDSEGSELNIFRQIYTAQNAEQTLQPIDGTNPTIKSADKYAQRVLNDRNGLASQPDRSYLDWVDDSTSKIQQMKNIERQLLEQMEQKARELKATSEQEAIISGALILLVLGVSLVGAFVVARSMIRSLRRLQETATKVAQDRLPELVKQLSESDPQDVDTSVESVGVHSRDEIGQVASAFDDVHREAVRLAAEQALLRGNVNAMFTNLSRRSQGLIQRQLSLISELESREADPDQLSSLFKLDHLATRMRRNGENLLVLAGEEPGRRWTRPVPLVDVLRAAASEVEQYERIELASVPTTEVAGRVVNDLVHLLAELLENATSFSSPQTKVKVTGHALPDGRVLIEIHDTGIGLSPEDLAAINERLAAPPTVDVSVSRRMGLFVVGRLSQRHGIRIQLRPSDSGGTTALVMLPVDVAQGGKKPAPGKPGMPGSGGGPAAAQAAAGAAAARRNNGGKGGAPGGTLGGAPAGGGLLGSGPGPRGQVGAGQGPRAALPGTGQGGRQGGPGGARNQQGPAAPQQGRSGPAGTNGFGAGQAPGASQGMQAANPGGSQQDAFGGRGPAAQRGGAADQSRQPQLPPRGGPRAELPGGTPQSRTPEWGDNAQAPVSRASLDAPRGHDEQAPARTGRMPRVDDRQGPGATAEMPRIGSGQDQAATGEFARQDLNGYNSPQDTGQFQRPGTQQGNGQFDQQDNSGQFQRPDLFGTPAPGHQGQQQHTGQYAAPQEQQHHTGQYGAAQGQQHTGQYAAPQEQQHHTGQYAAPQEQQHHTGQYATPQAYGNGNGNGNGYDAGSTGQHALPGRQAQNQPQNPAHTGQYERPQQGGHGDFGAQRPAAPQRPDTQGRPGDGYALPPAPSQGDGRTPLYDTLETNWFHGAPPEQQQAAAPAPQQQTPQAAASAPAPQRSASPTGSWRTSPNDELVRQAERVRQPAAGGITTSGLPRRVPKANLVPGQAQQQQQQQSGPQVSRAPDDVRGRLTNLRRGIAQGRQAGSGQTGSFPSPTHQQER
ncbi:nitrate- and nitrite sensing domain-containing protein [Streptomyces sp. NBC_00820]|uniref:nitrate- and nitrite sensing domain-containing protein n=1 Tax=Streptomyces sp. NBC_00820 TaxID=2975842 RepID=UPI002ED5C769|nr:nitrate- and nitrite sensing domain-containing protein [Streptomyces sp. NBC_00820]